MRLIDADALPEYDGTALSAAGFCEAVEDAPTIEAEPVRRGRWLPDTRCYYDIKFVCSACGTSQYAPLICDKPTWGYCPNCGAKMDGGKEDEK